MDTKCYSYTARDGLLSDNVGHIDDDGEGFLWLSTPRGLCRVEKQQLRDFRAGKIKRLTTENYGIEDGLRSGQTPRESIRVREEREPRTDVFGFLPGAA